MNKKPVTIEEKAEFIRWIKTDNKEEKTPEDYKLCKKLIKNDLDATDKLLHDYVREGGSWLWIRDRQEIRSTSTGGWLRIRNISLASSGKGSAATSGERQGRS